MALSPTQIEGASGSVINSLVPEAINALHLNGAHPITTGSIMSQLLGENYAYHRKKDKRAFRDKVVRAMRTYAEAGKIEIYKDVVGDSAQLVVKIL